jgi:nucleoside-diphosphate-sugar epimerase
VSGVLVVGAAGFIGRAVLAEAVRSGVPAAAIVGRRAGPAPGAHVLRLSTNAVDPLARLLERLAPGAIVNCAGRTSGAPGELERVNVDPVDALVAAMRLAVPRTRLVHLGSAAEYAEVAGATDEDAPLDAGTPYAAAKLAAFRHVQDAADSGLDAVVARVFNPIGPGVPESSLPGRATRLLRAALDRGDAEIELGPLDAVRDYLDVRDVATAVLALASARRLEHGVYNVGSGRPTLVRDLVRMIAERMGFSGAIGETATASPRSPGVRRQVADIGRIRSLGWEPAVPLQDSVDALVADTVEGSAT